MNEQIHKGHRKRMRAKFNIHGPRVFDTYELLEMLLYRVFVQGDTNPIAKQLLEKFGSIDGVLSADASELMTVEGIGKKSAELIVAVGSALSLCEEESTCEATFEDHNELGKYFVSYFEGRTASSVVMMVLDNSMRMIGMNELYGLDYASGKIQSKEFMDYAVRNGASVAIIAHNHPYGPICPTEGDRQTNIMVENALLGIGVILAEHYIICGCEHYGFMTKSLSSLFEQKPALGRFLRTKNGETDE